MSVPDRRAAVKELTDDGMSTREIGDVLGVSHVTVADDVKNLTTEEQELEQSRKRGKCRRQIRYVRLRTWILRTNHPAAE